MMRKILALVMAGVLWCAADEIKVSFAEGAWQASDWKMVKSPRWPQIGSWKQEAGCIVNTVPQDATETEMLGKRAPETYTSMVWKDAVKGSFTVRSGMDFAFRMAPLLVLANGLGANADGYPEYREHWEIVLYDEGLNVWHHQYVDGKPKWHKAAMLKTTFKKDTRYDLEVRVERSARGPQIIVKCGDAEFGYLEHELPEELMVGITACEGVNRFYDFSLSGKQVTK